MAHPITKVWTSPDVYFEVLRSHDIPGANLTEYWYPGEFSEPKHVHEVARFNYYYAGGQHEAFGKHGFEHFTGSLAFTPEDHEHAFHVHNTGQQVLVIDLESSWMSRAGDSRPFDPSTTRSGRLPALAARLYREFRTWDPSSSLIVEGLLLEMMGESMRRPDRCDDVRAPRWLVRARDMVESGFASSLTLDEIAAEVGVHPVYLARAFRRHYRCTVGERIRHLRVQLARGRLVASDEPLNQIALDAGFADQSHFSKTFKAVTGFTPSQYREGSF
jgi:AraC family transcriptional regulator